MDRRRQPERMDQPGLDPKEHARALAGLRRLNRVSGVAGSIWRELRPSAAAVSPTPLRVLDVACGGGDIARGIARCAKREGFAIELLGVDLSATAVSEAARPEDANVRFQQLDALKDPLPTGFDAVVCTLFVHHLDPAEARRLLARMGKAAGRVLLISDLRRTHAGWALAHLACRLFSRSPVVHYDGPISVEGAYTVEELRALASDAGLTDATIRHAWPQRMVLRWEPAG